MQQLYTTVTVHNNYEEVFYMIMHISKKRPLLFAMTILSIVVALTSNHALSLAAEAAYGYVSATPETGTFRVTFRPTGGYFKDENGITRSGDYILYNIYSGTKVASQEMPSPPYRNGYWFRGWYTDSLCTNEFDVENTKITANLILYAKWEQKNTKNPYLLSTTYLYQGKSYEISVDLTGQTLDSTAELSTGTVPDRKIMTAAQSIMTSEHYANPDNYYAFTYGINGCAIDKKPVPVTIKLPSGYSKDKLAVYYLTDHTDGLLISEGKMEPGTNNTAGQYTFLTFQQGTFLVVDTTANTTKPETPAAPYITLSGSETIKVNTTSDLQVILHNFDEMIQDFLEADEEEDDDEKSSKKASSSEDTLDADLECFDYKWSSDDIDIATVSANGCAAQITAKQQGRVTIKCICYFDSDKKYTATKTLYIVKNPPTRIKLNATKKTLQKGASFQIKTSFTPANCSNKELTYRSTNTSVATVSSTGKVKAKKKGTCYIYVRCKYKTSVYKRCKITVK